MLPDTFRILRLLLRPVAVEDTDAIFDTYVQDEEVARYVIWRPHRDRRETQTYIERCVATPHEVERTYMLVGWGENVIRGAFALRRRAPHRLDCGYVLARRWWGQGLMTEALSEVALWALRQPSIFRIGAVCDVDDAGLSPSVGKIGVRAGRSTATLASPSKHQRRAARLL